MQILFKNTVVSDEDLAQLRSKFPWDAFPAREGWSYVKADVEMPGSSELYALLPTPGSRTVDELVQSLTDYTVDLLVVNPGFMISRFGLIMPGEALFVFVAKSVADQIPDQDKWYWVLDEVDIDHVTYVGLAGGETGPTIRIEYDPLNPLKDPVASIQ